MACAVASWGRALQLTWTSGSHYYRKHL
jgi:hypothetical protein